MVYNKKCCVCDNRSPKYTLHRFPSDKKYLDVSKIVRIKVIISTLHRRIFSSNITYYNVNVPYSANYDFGTYEHFHDDNGNYRECFYRYFTNG